MHTLLHHNLNSRSDTQTTQLRFNDSLPCHSDRRLIPNRKRRSILIAIQNTVIRMWVGIKTTWYRQSTIRSLAPLNDHLLNDIGMDSCDITPLADSLASDYRTRQLARCLITDSQTASLAEELRQHSTVPPRLNRVRLHAR